MGVEDKQKRRKRRKEKEEARRKAEGERKEGLTCPSSSTSLVLTGFL